MDSGGGPGPPRPVDTPTSQLPSSHDSNIGLFPFNPTVAQQPPQLAVQIAPNRGIMGTNTHASTPFQNIPFLPTVPQSTPSVSVPSNNTQPINPQANMLHHINAVAAVAQQSASMQAGNVPQNVQQQQSRDFFGELEKAFASKPSHANSAPQDADALDNALAIAMASQATSRQQQTGAIDGLSQPQLQHAHLQRQRLQQLQMQHQLQQQLQQQQQQLQQQQHQLQHPSAIQQPIISRQQQQLHPYMQQKQLAPGQLNARMLVSGTTLPGQAHVAPALQEQALSSKAQAIGSQLVQHGVKVARKQHARRPRANPNTGIPIGEQPQISNSLATGPLNAGLPQQHQHHSMQALPGQLALNSQQDRYQQARTHLQRHQAGLPNAVPHQTPGVSHDPGDIQTSIASRPMPLNNSGGTLNTSMLQQQAITGRRAHQSGIQDIDSAALLNVGKVPQRIPQGNPEMANFDVATLQAVLRSTNDPKIEAAIKQQLEYLRYAAAFSGAQQRGQGSAKAQQVHSSIGTNAQQIRSLSQEPGIVGRDHSHASQTALLQRQQLAQKQELFRQQQQLQQRQLQQLRGQGSLPQVQRGVASQFRSQGLPVPLQGNKAAHVGQSTGLLPAHLGSQIQARQLQQPQRLTQHSQSSHSQSASQGTPSDFAGEGQASGSQNSQRQSTVRRPRRSPRSGKNDAEVGNGIPGISSVLAEHQTRNNNSGTASLSRSGTHGHVPGSRLSDLEPSQTKKLATQESNPSTSSRTPAEAVAQAAQAAQAAQLAAVRAANAKVRTVDESRATEDRKRLAREAELANIAEQKKRRLQTAPWNDYQRILAPDYTTPFSGLVDAWQRLVPYHVVHTDEDTCTSKEEWDSEIDKLSKKYRDCFRSLRGSLNRLFDAGYESIGGESELPGYSSLCKDDSLILDGMLLRDYYETAQKQALLAREKEMRRVAELTRQRTLAQNQMIRTQAAPQGSARETATLGSLPPAQKSRVAEPFAVSSTGALPPRSGPRLMPTAVQQSAGVPTTSSLLRTYNANTGGLPAIQQASAAQYGMGVGALPPSSSNALLAASLQRQASFGVQSYPAQLHGGQSAISTSLGIPQTAQLISGFNAQRPLNTNFQHAQQELNKMTSPPAGTQRYAQSAGMVTKSERVGKEQNPVAQMPSSIPFRGVPANGPQSLGVQSQMTMGSISGDVNWRNSGTMTAATRANPGMSTGTRMVVGGRSEIVRNGMQHSSTPSATAANAGTNTYLPPASLVGSSAARSANRGVKTSSATQARGVQRLVTAGANVSSLNGSRHEALNPKVPTYEVATSDVRAAYERSGFSKHGISGGNSAVADLNTGMRSVASGVGVLAQRGGASVGLAGTATGPSGVQNLQRSGRGAPEKASSTGVVPVDGSLGVLSGRPRDQTQGSGKGGEFRGMGMGSLLNADGS